MGLFSSVSKALFGDPTKGIKEATDASVKAQQQAGNFLQRQDQPLIDYRNKALGGLSDYYMGGPEGQQQFYDQAQQSPGYENYLQQGEERILRNAQATGGVRGGAVNPALALNQFDVTQGLVNQQLQGLGQFTNPNLHTNQIASYMAGVGNTQAQGITAQNQAQQNQIGQMLGLATGGVSAAVNLGWSPFSKDNNSGLI